MKSAAASHAVRLTGEDLTVGQFYEVAVEGRAVRLASTAKRRMAAANQAVREAARRPEPVYGVTTGFGKLADQRISPSDITQLQLNLVRSHAAGVGDPMTREETRGMMLLRANVLARGYSGVRPAVVEHLLTLLNREVLPVIPCRGSVGASGDLSPLAHLALPLIGEGEAWVDGRRR
ncbi:MAG: aromatic amino acid lyase, partial [Nitrospiraceae bacterium]|nr:aromatic amino acid lyase [Nitrospiraceae bacterium]